LERAQAQLETVYATIPIGLMYLSPDLIIERLSHRMAQFFGHRPEDPIKKPFQATVPERWNRLRRVVEEVARTGKPSPEIEDTVSDPRAPGGMRFFVSYCYPDLHENGRVQGIHVATLEVTAEKQAQKEREQDLKELKAKNREPPVLRRGADPGVAAISAQRRGLYRHHHGRGRFQGDQRRLRA